MNSNLQILLAIIVYVFSCMNSMAQRETNYDEAKVPDYALPKILVDQAGSTVTDASQWVNGRRAEILGMFETSVYGKTPRDPVQVEYRLHKSRQNALGGNAI